MCASTIQYVYTDQEFQTSGPTEHSLSQTMVFGDV